MFRNKEIILDEDEQVSILSNNKNKFYKLLKKSKLERLQILDELIHKYEVKIILNEKKLNSNNECKICFENKIDVCLIPCGHAFCKKCITSDKCYICNQIIEKKQILFI